MGYLSATARESLPVFRSKKGEADHYEYVNAWPIKKIPFWVVIHYGLSKTNTVWHMTDYDFLYNYTPSNKESRVTLSLPNIKKRLEDSRLKVLLPGNGVGY